MGVFMNGRWRLWAFAGSAPGADAIVIINLPDIKRYLGMRRM
jgi:hypothetical protein